MTYIVHVKVDSVNLSSGKEEMEQIEKLLERNKWDQEYCVCITDRARQDAGDV